MFTELGELARPVEQIIPGALEVARRMWERDHTVWDEDPTEIADRLGWLDAPERARRDAGALDRVRAMLLDRGVTDVLLVGMGGSSLYPAVLASVLGAAAGMRLQVLDSTDPAAVLAAERALPPTTTALVAASKSGTTIETTSHLDRFSAWLEDAHGADWPGMVVAVTDEGSPLERRGSEEGFAAVVRGHADVGGRFAALTPFGLLPAALLGADPVEHAAGAEPVLERSRSPQAEENDPAVLGAVLSAAAHAGRDKLTVLLPSEIATFGSWIEQLVAESTGKHGTGLLPVLGESPGAPGFGGDRVVVAYGAHDGVDELAAAGTPVVRLAWDPQVEIAGEVARWEVATAVCGALLGINPFDQPDVARAKDATSRALGSGRELPAPTPAASVLDTVVPGDYIALLGFVTPGGADEAALHATAERLRRTHRVPVTVGVGPRYLHSTGQLHKGGPDRGVFVLTVGTDAEDAAIPGREYGFSRLKQAQATGDLTALEDVGRRVAHVSLDDLAGS